MLQDIKQLYGKKLGATDGDVGHVKDFYFDDNTWTIRYLVADTGSWLPGRQVLLTRHALGNHAFGRSDADADVLRVGLTRKQIEDSPSIDSHRPVSRQYEAEYYRYYGWPNYWQDGGLPGLAGFPVVAPLVTPEKRPHHGHNQRDDIHLRSTKAMTGYQIQATDGPMGSVSSFMVDGKSWEVRDLVVETGHWYSGKEILIYPGKIDRISYEESTVFVKLTKSDIQRTAENEVATAGAVH
jgi:sporulation protein YlmC with PRC-barrel domain